MAKSVSRVVAAKNRETLPPLPSPSHSHFESGYFPFSYGAWPRGDDQYTSQKPVFRKIWISIFFFFLSNGYAFLKIWTKTGSTFVIWSLHTVIGLNVENHLVDQFLRKTSWFCRQVQGRQTVLHQFYSARSHYHQKTCNFVFSEEICEEKIHS